MQNAIMVKTISEPDPNVDTTARPAAAPRRRNRGIREHEILQAAFEEFAGSGYAATRLEDVARRASVAKGLPNFYFASKEELFRAVLRRLVLPDWEALDAQLHESDASTPALLRSLITMAYEQLVGNVRAHQLLRLLIAEGPKFPELTEFYHTEIVARAVALLGKILARGVERGEIRPAPVLDYPQAIMGPALMAVVWQLLFADRHPLDLAGLFEAHIDLVLNGLTPR
jgi:AcrR family transcriptional regulator